MQKNVLCICLLILTFNSSCRKDKDSFTTGTVLTNTGCFNDSWLVAIDNPDFTRDKFLRASTLAAAGTYNCSNAAYIKLPGSLATNGQKIRFTWTGSDASCLSFSEAPNHIRVKNLSKL